MNTTQSCQRGGRLSAHIAVVRLGRELSFCCWAIWWQSGPVDLDSEQRLPSAGLFWPTTFLRWYFSTRVYAIIGSACTCLKHYPIVR